MKGNLKKSVAVLLTATMVATPITAPESTKKVQAEQLGSIAKEEIDGHIGMEIKMLYRQTKCC